jgi:hypothetical protein
MAGVAAGVATAGTCAGTEAGVGVGEATTVLTAGMAMGKVLEYEGAYAERACGDAKSVDGAGSESKAPTADATTNGTSAGWGSSPLKELVAGTLDMSTCVCIRTRGRRCRSVCGLWSRG